MSSDNSKYYAVMLVDDNEIDNVINSKMIEKANLSEVTYTHNSAYSAIDFLKNIAKITTPGDKLIPRYIFLDIDMPMMDGFQFLEEFATMDPKLHENTRIIMLSASVNPKDKEKAKTSPYFYGYFNKPLKAADLQKL